MKAERNNNVQVTNMLKIYALPTTFAFQYQ